MVLPINFVSLLLQLNYSFIYNNNIIAVDIL